MSSRTRLEDLATIAGVSVATVSRALNNSPAVNEETKRRVWKIAREQNYHFRPSMPALLSGATATIAVVIPTPQARQTQVSDPFFQELIGGIAEAARASSCDILISHLAPKSQDDLTSLMTANRADGIIFLGQSLLHDQFNRLAETESRFIVWGADMPGQKYCSVGSDNLRGGKRAASHLLNLGRRRIAFLGDTAAPEVQQRYEGYVEAHRRLGLAVEPALIMPAQFEINFAESAVDGLIGRGLDFDGIFAAGDLIALGAIRSLLKSGRSVPDDVAVIGYDNIQLSAYTHPSLTTISQDMSKAGRLLVSKLLSATESSPMRSERLPTELIVRESCGLA
ncbi:MAG: LacI family transcriptional regulator [Hyphomonas sp.]|uniref:LacI family DNA-binding transcriptional regulator n=1 Tax=Hyphomonas sp. TaxID=87 RepID=UPI001807D412|nr:LacI family DNA-binding transcriptional regulator [Hyphomonas sp.]MBA3069630.1 LacI family transcriptional regulator [Hyphomonas sp.]MBU4062471.1 LacI family DNA-binding transcriptional regulator [Alphaproteobacteria bacterium]MBU4163822.1 LacI family DNA-binding transcriptional regulator [Alphaproteobacteria bacterium]